MRKKRYRRRRKYIREQGKPYIRKIEFFLEAVKEVAVYLPQP